MKRNNCLNLTPMLKIYSAKLFVKLSIIIVLLSVPVYNVLGVNSGKDVTTLNPNTKSDLTALMQQGKVTGKVLDEQGNPMPSECTG